MFQTQVQNIWGQESFLRERDNSSCLIAEVWLTDANLQVNLYEFHPVTSSTVRIFDCRFRCIILH